MMVMMKLVVFIDHEVRVAVSETAEESVPHPQGRFLRDLYPRQEGGARAQNSPEIHERSIRINPYMRNLVVFFKRKF